MTVADHNHLDVLDVGVEIDGDEIVRGVSFSLADGEIGSLLGPSGCGKTTLLRTIAGFLAPASGEIRLRGKVIAAVGRVLPPERRRIGMVFQDLALFPHLTVRDNVAFGIRKQAGGVVEKRVSELLALVNLADHASKYPHELSGGQQQRIALVRAMAPKPAVLLLDEPFSGQDLELREQLAREVRAVLRHDGVTALLVTHDQFEAFAFADVVGVMNQGRLHQWDSGFNLYHRPADRFVADFIGHGIFIPGTILDDGRLQTEIGALDGELTESYPAGTPVELLLRPDDILHDDHSETTATVEAKAFRGADHLYTLRLDSGASVLCHAPSHHNHRIGERIGIRMDLKHLAIFPLDQRRSGTR